MFVTSDWRVIQWLQSLQSCVIHCHSEEMVTCACMRKKVNNSYIAIFIASQRLGDLKPHIVLCLVVEVAVTVFVMRCWMFRLMRFSRILTWTSAETKDFISQTFIHVRAGLCWHWHPCKYYPPPLCCSGVQKLVRTHKIFGMEIRAWC